MRTKDIFYEVDIIEQILSTSKITELSFSTRSGAHKILAVNKEATEQTGFNLFDTFRTPKGEAIFIGVNKTDKFPWFNFKNEPGLSFWDNVKSIEDAKKLSFEKIEREKFCTVGFIVHLKMNNINDPIIKHYEELVIQAIKENDLKKAWDYFKKAYYWSLDKQIRLQIIKNHKKRIYSFDSDNINQNDIYSYYFKIMFEIELSNYKEALKICNKAIEVFPSEADFYHCKGIIYIKLIVEAKHAKNNNYINLKKEYTKNALENFILALKNNYSYRTEIFSLISTCYFKLNCLEEATKYGLLAIDTDQPSLYDIYTLGKLHFRNNKYDEGIKVLTPITQMTCKSKVHAFYYRAMCHEQLHNYEEALSDYQKVIELKGKHLKQALTRRGLLYVFLRDFDSALSELKQAVKQDRLNENLHWHLGNILLQQCHFPEAHEYFDILINLSNKKLYKAYEEMCSLIIKNKENENSELFNDFLIQCKQSGISKVELSEIYKNLSLVYIYFFEKKSDMSILSKALEWIDSAINLQQSNNMDNYLQRIYIHMHLKKNTKIISDIHKVINSQLWKKNDPALLSFVKLKKVPMYRILAEDSIQRGLYDKALIYIKSAIDRELFDNDINIPLLKKIQILVDQKNLKNRKENNIILESYHLAFKVFNNKWRWNIETGLLEIRLNLPLLLAHKSLHIPILVEDFIKIVKKFIPDTIINEDNTLLTIDDPKKLDENLSEALKKDLTRFCLESNEYITCEIISKQKLLTAKINELLTLMEEIKSLFYQLEKHGNPSWLNEVINHANLSRTNTEVISEVIEIYNSISSYIDQIKKILSESKLIITHLDEYQSSITQIQTLISKNQSLEYNKKNQLIAYQNHESDLNNISAKISDVKMLLESNKNKISILLDKISDEYRKLTAKKNKKKNKSYKKALKKLKKKKSSKITSHSTIDSTNQIESNNNVEVKPLLSKPALENITNDHHELTIIQSKQPLEEYQHLASKTQPNEEKRIISVIKEAQLLIDYLDSPTLRIRQRHAILLRTLRLLEYFKENPNSGAASIFYEPLKKMRNSLRYNLHILAYSFKISNEFFDGKNTLSIPSVLAKIFIAIAQNKTDLIDTLLSLNNHCLFSQFQPQDSYKNLTSIQASFFILKSWSRIAVIQCSTTGSLLDLETTANALYYVIAGSMSRSLKKFQPEFYNKYFNNENNPLWYSNSLLSFINQLVEEQKKTFDLYNGLQQAFDEFSKSIEEMKQAQSLFKKTPLLTLLQSLEQIDMTRFLVEIFDNIQLYDMLALSQEIGNQWLHNLNQTIPVSVELMVYFNTILSQKFLLQFKNILATNFSGFHTEENTLLFFNNTSEISEKPYSDLFEDNLIENLTGNSI